MNKDYEKCEALFREWLIGMRLIIKGELTTEEKGVLGQFVWDAWKTSWQARANSSDRNGGPSTNKNMVKCLCEKCSAYSHCNRDEKDRWYCHWYFKHETKA